MAYKIFETGYEIGEKAIAIRINLKKESDLSIAESDLDGLKSLISSLNISRLVDYDWSNNGHVFEQDIAKKIQEFANMNQQSDVIIDLVSQLDNVCTQACEELKEELNKIKNTK